MFDTNNIIDRRRLTRIAMTVIRSHLNKHPEMALRINNPFAAWSDSIYPNEPWTAKILEPELRQQHKPSKYLGAGETRADAVIALATQIANDTLPTTALYVLLDWLHEHEATTLEIQSPFSDVPIPRWAAEVTVPVVQVANCESTDPDDALIGLAYEMALLPKDWTEC